MSAPGVQVRDVQLVGQLHVTLCTHLLAESCQEIRCVAHGCRSHAQCAPISCHAGLRWRIGAAQSGNQHLVMVPLTYMPLINARHQLEWAASVRAHPWRTCGAPQSPECCYACSLRVLDPAWRLHRATKLQALLEYPPWSSGARCTCKVVCACARVSSSSSSSKNVLRGRLGVWFGWRPSSSMAPTGAPARRGDDAGEARQRPLQPKQLPLHNSAQLHPQNCLKRCTRSESWK